jgi:ectoine hydroxylase-related dioxygenase (phytanoyl-CoA dioxygenase family)
MALLEDQIEHYYREGYIVIPGLVPPEAVQGVLAAAPRDVHGAGWQARVFSHTDPDTDAGIHRLLVEPGVVDAVESIFAAPARVFYGMLAVVPAHGGTGLPWHQDNQYTHLLGGALNVFIALSEITPNKAILWVAPRSHLFGRLPARGSDLYGGSHREAVQAPENGMPLPTMQSGDACIFDRYLLHRSLQNETDADRYAYAAQYQSENTRVADTGKKDPMRMLARDLRRRWLDSAGLTKSQY